MYDVLEFVFGYTEFNIFNADVGQLESQGN